MDLIYACYGSVSPFRTMRCAVLSKLACCSDDLMLCSVLYSQWPHVAFSSSKYIEAKEETWDLGVPSERTEVGTYLRCYLGCAYCATFGTETRT